MAGPLAHHWTLDPEVVYLSHGSFGACPRVVLEAQQRLRDELERQPVSFFLRRFNDRLDASRARLAGFLGADPECLAAVPNATTGVNSVLRSLRLEPGDELVVTDHEYNASRNALDFVAERNAARVVVVPLPFPGATAEGVETAILGAVTPRTRLALFDHITSQTGMILPVENLVLRLGERGVDTLIDGAHAPGMVPLNLGQLGSAYYSGNCHKWLCAPKGAGFLYVREDRRDRIHPLAISHGANAPREGRSRFHDEFDWMGTSDPSAFLCVPGAIEFVGSLLPGGWPEVMRHNRALALAARARLADALGVGLPCPDAMIGSLASLPLPDGSPEQPGSALHLDPLQDLLLENHHIEVPIMPWPAPPQRLIRISAQLYNSESDYERLAQALHDEL